MGTTTNSTAITELVDYTIPRNKWELQPCITLLKMGIYYTIPRNKWELQLWRKIIRRWFNYTIPRNKWELQLIVTKLYG